MNLFQNLCPHESILLILGVVLFAVLIFLLVFKTVKERKIGMLLPFFLLPIVMIGYPSIGSIQYEKGTFQLQPLVGQFMEGNISEGQIEEFMKVYEMVAQSFQSNHDTEAQTTLAQAQLATGNYEHARLIADRALSLQPQREINPALTPELLNQQRFKTRIIPDINLDQSQQ